MFHPLQDSNSIWQQLDGPVFQPLNEDLETDICIVGAGIAGLTTAYLLLKNGFDVVVLDRGNFGVNETGFSSAHLSSALDEGYSKLQHVHGEKGARLAYDSHSDAIDLIEKIINEENIDCDFRRVDGYLYLSPDTSPAYLEDELQAAQKAGFKDTSLQVAPRYFAMLGPCIQYPRQARLHPLKYTRGLLQAITKMKGRVHSLTSVMEFKGGPEAYVATDFGNRVKARHIVVTTNVPANDRVQIHNKEAAYRSYVLGIDVPKGTFPDILLWDTDEPYHYVRKTESNRAGFETVLIGGEDHRVGQQDMNHNPYEALENWARARLGLQGEVSYRWSGQIIEPFDGLAFIGRNPRDEKNVYIATGDSGHGLTHGTIAGTIIRDLIQETPNEWTALYEPGRISLRAVPNLLKESYRSFRPYEDHLRLYKKDFKEILKPGEGHIVRDGTREVAVYCDENKELHSFSAVCPHLGGVVHWNEQEKTWDCPCHGSRYACTGEVLNGPAISGLRPVPNPAGASKFLE